MSGEVKAYRMNDPMAWAEYKTMPDDLKITYIKLLREKFRVSDTKIGAMFGVSQKTISIEMSRLGIGLGKRHVFAGFDKDGWEAWCNHTQTEEPELVENEGVPHEAEFVMDEPEKEPAEIAESCHAADKLGCALPKTVITAEDKETFQRALGYIEGLATGVCNERLRDGLFTAVEMISEVLDK